MNCRSLKLVRYGGILALAIATAHAHAIDLTHQFNETTESLRLIQQAPPNPGLQPFGDFRDFVLLKPFVYQIGETNVMITVPAGFVTDLASVPKWFWGPPLFYTPEGQYGRAAIVHDYLYWSHKCTRSQADNLLAIAMKESAVKKGDLDAIYKAVDWGAQSAWDADKSEHDKLLPRVLEPNRWTAPDPNTTWPEYQKQLTAAGVKSLDPPDTGIYCKYGDTRDVPKHN